MLNKILLMLTSIITLLIPIQGLLILVFSLVVIDSAYAIYATIKMNGRKSFKSILLRKGLTRKVFYYFTSIIIMYAVDTLIFGGSLFGIKILLAKAITVLFIYTEGKSLDEINQNLGGKPFIDTAKEALSFYKKAKQEIEDAGIKKD
jgi:hypothetical protein